MRAVLFVWGLALSTVSCAQLSGFTLFQSNLSLGENCTVSLVKKGEVYKFAPKFKAHTDCVIATHSETNIPKVQFVNGMYVFFVESRAVSEDVCKSEYTAMGVDKNGALLITDLIKSSGSCVREPDQLEFEYFASKLKLWSTQY